MGLQTEQATQRTLADLSKADVAPTCDELDCEETATHAYTWEWGQSGYVCAKHAALLGQRAANLNRTVSVHPIQMAGPQPLQRDERIALRVKAEVLSAELEEAKGRGLELYRANVDLSKQVQTLTLRAREASAQMEAAGGKAAELQAKLDQRDAEHGELVDELERLRTLAKFVDEQTQPS